MTKHILLIDDDPALLASENFLLTQAGYQVCEARNCCEALQKISEQQNRGGRFDLLVTEIQKPGMSGNSLIRLLNSHDIRIPILVLTGFPDAASFRELQQIRHLGILVKPFKMDELTRLIELLTGADFSCISGNLRLQIVNPAIH